MKFITIDLELDQPTNHIIQIGAAQFCTDTGRSEHFNCYVDPGHPIGWGHKLNIGCTLEGLLAPGFRKKWEVQKLPTKEALASFWRWQQSRGKKFIQWGRGDMRILEKESQIYPAHLRTLDLKMAYQFLWQPSARLEKNAQLGTACLAMDVDPPYPAHDAFEDAFATGKLFLKMFGQVKGLNQLLKGLKDA